MQLQLAIFPSRLVEMHLHTRTHARTYAHTHARTHARMHALVGVRQAKVPIRGSTPTFSNIFLETIMSDVLEELESIIRIAGQSSTNLRFADDIDGLAGNEQ